MIGFLRQSANVTSRWQFSDLLYFRVTQAIMTYNIYGDIKDSITFFSGALD
jgi:hypothetical protein